MANIDELDIQIKANADNANKALERLVKNLSALSNGLNSINTSGLKDLADSISKIGDAMKNLKGINSRAFERLAANIDKLGNIDASKIMRSASALNQMAQSIQSLAGLQALSDRMGELARNIQAVGRINVQRFISQSTVMNRNLREMMNALARAPTNIGRGFINATINGFTRLGSVVKNTSHNLILGLKNIGTAMKKTGDNSFSMAAAFGKFYATYFLVIRGIKKLWSDTKTAMDYVETYNYFNTALGKVENDFLKQFEKFGEEDADVYVKSFGARLRQLNQKMTGYQIGSYGELNLTNSVGLGMDPERLMNFQAQIMGVTNAVGLMGETSTNASKALSMLAGDLSSLTNRDLASVMNDMQSGLIGQSRALYKYGIDITANTMQQKAFQLGIEKSVSKMSQAEKMQLRLLMVLDQSKVAWGDLGNTINSSANLYRQLTAAASNLGRTIGSLLMPAVKAALPPIIGMTLALNKLLDTIGYQVWGEDWKKNLMDGISGFAAVDDMADMLGDDLDDVAKSANDVKKGIRGFDELNVIGAKADKGDSGLEDTFDLWKEIQDAVSEYEKVWNEAYANAEPKAEKFAKAISGILLSGDFELIGQKVSDVISNSLNGLDWKNIKAKTKNFGRRFANLLNGLLNAENFKTFGKTIANGINTAFEFVNGFADNFNFENLGIAISNGINTAVSEVDVYKIASGISRNFVGIGNAVATFLKETDFRAIGERISEFIISIDWSGIINVIKDDLSLGFTAIQELFAGLFENVTISDNLIALKDPFTLGNSIADFIKKALSVPNWDKIEKDFEIIGTNIANFLNGIIEPSAFEKMGETIADAINTAIGFASRLVNQLDFKKLGNSLSIFINKAIKEIDISKAGRVFSNAVNEMLNLATVIMEEIDFYAIGEKIGAFLQEVDWTLILSNVVSAFWKGLQGAFDAWQGSFDVAPIETTLLTAFALINFTPLGSLLVKGLLKSVSSVFEPIIDFFSTTFAGVFSVISKIFSGVGLVVGGIVLAVKGFIDMWKNGYNVISEILMAIGAAIAAVGAIILGVPGVVAAVVAAIVVVVANLVLAIHEHWDVIKDILLNITETVLQVCKSIADFVIGVIRNIFVLIGDVLKGIYETVNGTLTAIFLNFRDIFVDIIHIFQGIVEFVAGVFTGDWSRAWKGVVSVFENIFNGIVDVAKIPINLVIGLINGMLSAVESGINFIIKSINTLSFEVPSWVPGIGGETFGFNLNTVSFKQIEYLASGGFPDKSSVFVAGENGIPEMLGQVNGRTAVAGGEEITGIADAVYSTSDAQTALLRQQNELLLAILNKETGISKDDLFRSVRSSANDFFSRTGRQPFPT